MGGASYELRLFEGSLRNILGAKGYYFRDEMWATSQPFALEISPHSQHASFSWGFVEALSWQPWQQLTLKASLQLQSRLPTSFELFGDGMSILPGYQLRPERSLNTNLGLVWLINGTGYPHARVDLQGFYMQIRDLIQLTMGFAFNLLHRNIMQASGYGADGEVEVHWLPYLSTRANATYYRSALWYARTQCAMAIWECHARCAHGGPVWHTELRITLRELPGYRGVQLRVGGESSQPNARTPEMEPRRRLAHLVSWALPPEFCRAQCAQYRAVGGVPLPDPWEDLSRQVALHI